MKLPPPQVFHLQLKPKSTYTVLSADGSHTGFTKPATLVCPKIYIVTESGDVHYVGVTNRPMASRLNTGLKARGKGGYHGYMWKSMTTPLVLNVWSFPNEAGKVFLRELETVEAEFAYLVRNTTGHWPLSQTEIHFYKATPSHLKAVAALLAHCVALE